RKLFKNLYIEKTETFKEQGQYPVVFLSLKDLKATTWEEMERKIIIILSDFFSEYEYLLNELTGISFENLKNIIYRKADIDELTTTLKFLTKILYEK
ncbi:AAA family ATPase, partial [Fusobacterium nucleatum]